MSLDDYKMEKLYKITKIDGIDWYSGKIKYEVGKIVEAPDWKKTKECGNGLHLVDDINKIKYIYGFFKLPCRIFEVKIIGKDYVKFDDKIKCKKLKVVKELSIKEINKLLKDIKMIDNSSAELWDNSSAKLLHNSSALLYNDSSAELWDNSSAKLLHNSSAELWDNSSAKLYDNSVVYAYSENVTFIPKSQTCVVILPYNKVFTFKKSQLNKKYKIKNLKLVEVK